MLATWEITAINGQLRLTYHPLDGPPRQCGDGPLELFGELLAFVSESAAEADIIVVRGRVFVKHGEWKGAN